MYLPYFISILRNYAALNNVTRTIIRHQHKTIIGDNYRPLTKSTLLGRMLLYLNNDKSQPQDQIAQLNGTKIIDSLVHGRTSVLRSLSVDEITGLFYSANTTIFSHRKGKLRKVLELLDIECCLRANDMDLHRQLKLLNAFMHVVPNCITEFKFYYCATENIDRCLHDISKKHLLQFIFYIGLQKKSTRAQVVLKKCLKHITNEYLDSLSVEDLCIICNSSYRTQTKIKSTRILDKIRETINNNLNLLKDPALLITLIKTIKQNHYQDDDLLSTISCTIFFNNTSQYYTFTALSHILSLYADSLYYDEELLKLLYGKSVEHLKAEASPVVAPKRMYFTEHIRAKDITTFLWSLSTLGYTDIEDELFKDLFVPKIIDRIGFGEYKKYPEELINCILYMWILNYRAHELITYAFTPENLAAVGKNRTNLNLLLKLIEYEEPNLFAKLNVKVGNFCPIVQTQNRPMLQRVFNVLTISSTNFKMECQIPHVNIIGITGCVNGTNKTVNVEVLDHCNCVKNATSQPTGLMQLKLRILEELDVPLVIVDEKEVESKSDAELQTFLQEEIKFKC